MKKLLSAVTALALSVCMTAPLASHADYTPTVYFSPHADTNQDGTLVIRRSELTDDLTFTADVFINDESKLCWSVDPKWKCPSPYITLSNVIDPQSPYIPYTYAEEKDGELTTIRHYTNCGQDTELNTMFFACDLGTLYTDNSPLTPYGENTTDYALTSFDFTISSDIPDGDYEIYFLTQSEDYEDQRYSTVSMRTESGSVTAVPNTESLHIRVTSLSKGDVNQDGEINASDASAVLADYSKTSTGAETGLTDEQFYAGDINSDNIVDSNDASALLAYYSYTSTGGELSIEDYFK